jgi:hypothetical protein
MSKYAEGMGRLLNTSKLSAKDSQKSSTFVSDDPKILGPCATGPDSTKDVNNYEHLQRIP